MADKLTVYCIGAEGLANQLWSEMRIRESPEKCQEYLDGFFRTYPGVARYVAETKAFAARYGFTYTYTGRRRRFAISAFSRAHASRMSRQAVNVRIQSTSSDLVACNMIDLHWWLKRHGGRLLLTVHDSFPFQLPKGIGCIKEELDAIIMANTAIRAPWLPVEWKYDVGKGPNYGDTHGEVT
ncbi:MAG: DNA polymerase [Mailhella sp.]